MPQTHIVQPGECLASIAAAFHLRSWETLYNAPENSALRQKRPNPNVLYAGDEVIIPDLAAQSFDRPVDQQHNFVVQIPRWVLRIRMLDDEGNPIGGAPYTLTPSGAAPIQGQTGADGMIEEPLPGETRSATLEFMGEEFDLQIGMLDPISRVKGVQARLNNLGFGAGSIDGIVGPRTLRAIYGFQLSEGLAATGIIDDTTLKQLLLSHDADSNYTPMEEDMGPQDAPADTPEEQEPGEDPPDAIDDAPQTDWCGSGACHA